ncbi:MAG: hypothetical protein QOJ07_1810, partial [Thermoleophilaceae bacterium]|nr:hypothetical protein [Thermoleophilaceae bacterium]
MPEAERRLNELFNVRLGHTRSGAPAVEFSFPFNDDLNSAVKGLPGRVFDWERRVWLIPIDQPVAQDLSAILARHRWLSVSPELAGWLRAVDGW